MKGKEFTVEFSQPTPIQLDGESFEGQTGYHAVAKHTVDL